jgi:intracellular multiplication protein IcmB
MDAEVDDAMKKYNIHLPKDPYWWDIVEQFFDRELYHLANLAQRHAVPVLGDAITAARRPQIRSLLDETQIGSSAEGVINAFERMITSAIREYPILASITKFEITDARVCSLDLMDVSPQGDETADRQTSIMYMLARHALVRSWWASQEQLVQMPEKYRPYHESRLQELAETPKRMCYDEFHRTSKSKAVRGQIIRDVREGRKRGVQIVLASQLIDDFDSDMVDLATGVWILGTAISDRAVDAAQNTFGLSNTARHVIRHQLTGPRSSGAPALFVLGTKEGRYEQHLINTLGPIELWALSTSAEDVAIRNRLYSRLGAGRGRQMLAASFPGGSARTEIKRRVFAKAEKGETQNAATGAVIEEIVNELVALSQKQEREEREREIMENLEH